MVTRTGWKTAKGHLVRSILNVKPVVYKYQREAIGFLVFLIAVGVGLFFVSLTLWGTFSGESWDNENILFGFEAIAILVPPMLPALFHVCILAAAKTLKVSFFRKILLHRHYHSSHLRMIGIFTRPILPASRSLERSTSCALTRLAHLPKMILT